MVHFSSKGTEDNMAAITTEGANVMEGTKVSEASGSGQSKVGSARKKNRSRSASASSVDSVSSGSYTGNEELLIMLLKKRN